MTATVLTQADRAGYQAGLAGGPSLPGEYARGWDTRRAYESAYDRGRRDHREVQS